MIGPPAKSLSMPQSHKPHTSAFVRLHRRFGFRRVGVEREVGRKFDRWLDVVVTQKALAE